MGAPCVHAGGEVSSSQSTASWVSDLRNDPLHWVTATSAPCTSMFHPVRVDQPVDQDSTFGPDPTNRFDGDTRWWAHELLHRLVLRDHESSLVTFAADRDRLERDWIAAPPMSEVAFAMSADAEQRWLAALVAADHPDVRPTWLADLWRDLGVAAGLPAVAPT
jgi:dipeptidase